ncbi:hypothetical protein, conserved [Leishmania donovani]|uniref:Uncharacterized protein n=1 Tax=Leishmania donovani TaxID=5661 RepID=E9BAS1_LEIDO|nr:hypothetical protein, conserved [Leishmania donovani]AYU76851.1 hypothetical protein LdCL_110013700 [Leishmania donovani]CBZ32346.1 hypothetical protein, conserved [Leishmania donovani]
MPSKPQQQYKTLNGTSGGAGKSPAAAAKSTATTSASPAPSTPPPLPFNSIPHATSGDRLIGVEVGSSIPALMSELGDLLQQTPGSGSGGVAGGLWRGQNGGLLFEHLDGAAASQKEAAAALFGGIDANRRIEQISPGALERLSQVFSMQQRQSGFASAAAGLVAAAGASAALKCSSSSRGGVAPSTVEVLDDDEDGDMDSASGSSTAADEVFRAVYRDSGSDCDASSTTGRRHNFDDMFEMMQRSIGNYARGGGGSAGDKGAGGSGVVGLDPSAYSDPLAQLELFRAMMVATSKGRSSGGGSAAQESKPDDAEARPRVISESNLPNHFRNFLDALSPQLISQLMLQQRTAKAASAGAGGVAGAGKTGEATAAAAAAVAREVDMAASGVANLSDLQQRVEQVRGLSSSTLEALAEGEVSDSTSGSLRDLLLGDSAGAAASGAVSAELELSSAKVGYCLTEAAAVAVSMLWSYLGSQQKEAPLLLGYTREEAQNQFNLLLFRLRQELFAQPTASLEEVSRCFGGAVQADAEDIYRAINGVGVLLFFTCKPLPLLEKTCSELRISLSDSANTDCNIMPELIAEKLAAFLYPMKEGKLSFAHLSFIPRLQVHEHAPGNYTCTIDNASNMGRMLRERLLSNRFSCNKIKWRAALMNDKGKLKFQVWHRHATPLSVHFIVRTSEPKKKKKSGCGNAGVNGAAGEEKDAGAASAVEDLRANSALFVEQQLTAAPGEMVGFTHDFIELTVALSSPTTLQHGYRTYNKADDRLVFQFSLQLSNVDGGPLDGAAAANAGNKVPVKQANEDQEPSLSGSTEGKTDGGESKDDPDAELHAAMRRVSDSETAARAVIEETAKWDYRHLQNDECREAHCARQRTEDRERKALLAKVGPTPELIREVDKLSQSVQAAQQQIAKLNKERSKDEKEGEKTAEKLAQHQAELSSLLSSLESGEAELSRLEAEMKAAEARIVEKRARQARKEAKKAEQSQWTALKRVLEPTSSTTHHDTLAINDFGSFLQSTPIMAAAMPLQQQQEPAALPTAPSSSSLFGSSAGCGPGIPPLAGGTGGLGAFGTDRFSARAPMSASPGTGVANTTPVFSTQPKMGLGSSSSLVNTNGNTSPGVNVGAVGGGHPHMNGISGSTHGTTPSHPGRVSPMLPPSPGVVSNASAAMGSRSSPASAAGAPIGSPGMPLSGGSGVSGNIGMGSGGSGGNGVGGLSFGLAPSLFSTNPVSHVTHSAGATGTNASNTPRNLYTSLDANAQPFSPSPPPTMSAPGTGGCTTPAASGSGAGNASGSHSNSSSGGIGFAFTVTAGAHPGLVGGSSSPIYQSGPSGFSSGSAHDLPGHSPSPFSTTPMPTPAANGVYGMGGGNHCSTHDMQHQHAHQPQHSGLLPPRPHTPNELLSFSTSLQWRN